MHNGLQYDSMYNPRARLTSPIQGLDQALDKAIKLLGKVEVIVVPWEHALPFQRQWESIPAIKSIRDTQAWLWGCYMTYRGIDCLASSMVQQVVVSGVRDLREAYGPEDRVVLIEVTQ